MKNVKQISIVMLLACVTQIAKSNDVRYDICAHLPANVKLKARLVADKKYSCRALVDSCGQVNQTLIDELMDAEKTPLSSDITQTPYYLSIAKRLAYLQTLPYDPWDHDESDLAARMSDLETMQRLYKYLHPYFSNETYVAQTIETFLEWSEQYNS